MSSIKSVSFAMPSQLEVQYCITTYKKRQFRKPSTYEVLNHKLIKQVSLSQLADYMGSQQTNRRLKSVSSVRHRNSCVVSSVFSGRLLSNTQLLYRRCISLYSLSWYTVTTVPSTMKRDGLGLRHRPVAVYFDGWWGGLGGSGSPNPRLKSINAQIPT